MVIGIVGHEALKFTPQTEAKAKAIIREILSKPGVTDVASGHCHLGGIDIWAEEIGKELGFPMEHVYPPKKFAWEGGFKQRNIQIAEASTSECHCIVVKEYPPTFTGRRFNICYHCDSADHIKSGGCWTVHYAIKLGKKGVWHVI